MGKNEAIEKVKKYADTIISEFNPNMIVLFGSYAKGTEKENSDIDVAVIVDKIEGDYLDILFRLYKMRRNIDESFKNVFYILQCEFVCWITSTLNQGIEKLLFFLLERKYFFLD
jgi:uncharacterized protein